MSVNTLTLTAGNPSNPGFAIAELAAVAPFTGAPYGALSPSTMDSNNVGAFMFAFASSNNSTVNLDVQYSGTPPLDNYITSVTFTGDTGAFALNTVDATTSLDSGTTHTFKRWTWHRFPTTGSFPSNLVCFTNGNNYAITITTNPAPTGNPLPDVTGLTLAAATAAIVAGGFVLGTVTGSNNASFAAGQIISQSPVGGTLSAPGTVVALTECFGPITLTAKFVPAVDFKAIMVANPGFINPRVYDPIQDTTVRITK